MNTTPLLDFESIRLIVFDLDGTLYENSDQYEIYARCLAQRLPPDKRGHFWDDYMLMLSGRHPLRYGRTYDTERQIVFETSGHSAKAAYAWDGTPVEMDSPEEQVSLGLPRYIIASDPWWPPHACARHYGLGDKEQREAFWETRRQMTSPGYKFVRAEGLSERLALASTRYHQVLMTNSREHDARLILDALGLSGVFDMELFHAGKPHNTKRNIQRMCAQFSCEPAAVLSIGDNPYNEVYPALGIGCQAVLVDPLGCYSDQTYTGLKVKSLGDLLPLLLVKHPFRDGPPENAVREEMTA